MRKIAVLGAGIAGVTTAYSLRERGFDVTLIDRQRYAGMETSFANGGQLSVSNAEVWNQWSTVAKGMKWLFSPAAPLLVNPSPSWHKYSWMGEFIGQIPGYRANTVRTVKLALAARKRLFELAEREQIAFDHEKRGILHIYRRPQSLAQARKVNAMLIEGGLDRHEVTPDEIGRIEPALREPCTGGFFTASDSTGDIHKFTRGLADACSRHGVTMQLDSEVQQLAPEPDGVRLSWIKGGVADEDKFDGVVVCAGTRSRHFAAMAGDRVNVYPVKGYSITVHLDEAESRAATPWVSLLDDDAKIVTSRLGEDRFRVAGTAEFNGENRDIRADRIAPLTAWCRRLFPEMGTARIVPWCGLRPMMPDMLPRVGPGRQGRVFYNTGHGHLGWTLSAATAEIVTGMVEAKAA
jgi:D-amino-acid dehydrogenase